MMVFITVTENSCKTLTELKQSKNFQLALRPFHHSGQII